MMQLPLPVQEIHECKMANQNQPIKVVSFQGHFFPWTLVMDFAGMTKGIVKEGVLVDIRYCPFCGTNLGVPSPVPNFNISQSQGYPSEPEDVGTGNI